jgi:hypothetical protein
MLKLLSTICLVLATTRSTTSAYHHGTGSATIVKHARDLQTSYDYVIIGGGTSGLTIADRLTQDGKATVLVIEHGDLGETSYGVQSLLSIPRVANICP